MFLISLLTVFAATSCLATSLTVNNTPFNQTYNASAFPVSQILYSPYPYDFPVSGNGDEGESSPFPMEDCNGLTLEEVTIDQLQQYMSVGLITSVDLCLCYLRRMDQTDQFIQ